jgi:hypothetical protein
MAELSGLAAGFSGTRGGLTSFQRQNLMDLLVELSPEVAHHGDCVGADAELHIFCVGLRIKLHVHPPDNPRWRAFSHLFYDGDLIVGVEEEKPFITRNRDIVDACDYLVAAPRGPEERRSGTWATIRHARGLRLPVFLLHPDGRVDRPAGGR